MFSFSLVTAALAVLGAVSAQRNDAVNDTSVPSGDTSYTNPYTQQLDLNGNPLPIYSPMRAPALPLAVRSPYTSAWTQTSGNTSLNSGSVIFWNGDKLGWEGIIKVDGINYEWLGVGLGSLPALPNIKTAQPLNTTYDSQYSNFTFAAGPIELTAMFFSPVIPKDYCRTSIPFSYLTVSVRSTDGAAHDVDLYTDVDGSWTTNDPGSQLNWALYADGQPTNASNTTVTASTVLSWLYGPNTQYEFGEASDHPLYGNFTWTTSQGDASTVLYSSGKDVNERYNFTQGMNLNNVVDPNFRGSGSNTPVFAYQHKLGMVGGAASNATNATFANVSTSATTGAKTVTFSLGTVQVPSIKYLTPSGITPLLPWWATSYCYGSDVQNLVQVHYRDLPNAQVLGARYEAQLKADVARYFDENPSTIYSQAPPSPPPPYANGTHINGTNIYNNTIELFNQMGQQYVFNSDNGYGFLEPNHTCYADGIAVPDVSEAESYYAIVALATRQVMGAYVLAERAPDSKNASIPLMFQKEISSDGNVNTVDVMFPAHPFFLYSNPELLRFNLEPLYENQEGHFYPNQYSMHDLGSAFPNATGHVEGNDEYQPVEECGNMVLMTLAYYRFSNNLAFLTEHYDILKQWTAYLLEFALIPSNQLSTDDFAGTLANQTNLAIKGIVGIQAMSEISALVGNAADSAMYAANATDFYNRWEVFAVDPSERHTVLGYEWRSSWGLLYNTYPDKLLNLGVVSQEIYDMQSEWYPTVSQVFGVPLDSRASDTKSDWEMWTAATTSPSTRALLVTSLAYWINNTVTNLPFSDLFETISQGQLPTSPTFINRPVQGGLFSLLAIDTPQIGQNATTAAS